MKYSLNNPEMCKLLFNAYVNSNEVVGKVNSNPPKMVTHYEMDLSEESGRVYIEEENGNTLRYDFWIDTYYSNGVPKKFTFMFNSNHKFVYHYPSTKKVTI